MPEILIAAFIMLAASVLFCCGCAILGAAAYVWIRATPIAATRVVHAAPPDEEEGPPPQLLYRPAPDVRSDDDLVRAAQMAEDYERGEALRRFERGDMNTDDNVSARDLVGSVNGFYPNGHA